MKKHTLKSYVELLSKEKLTVNIFESSPAIFSQTEICKRKLSKRVFGLYCDSRRCESDGIFFCKGRKFLMKYLTEALQKGVAAVIYEKDFFKPDLDFDMFGAKTVPECIFIEVKNVRKAMAVLAAFHFDYPMKKAITVAVTGTKGKTSTVTAVRDILNENPNFKAIILNDALPCGSPRLTTPEPIELHAAAAKCIEHKATHIICEVSSQGVKEMRTHGIVFDLACFLNFGIDHVSPTEHPTLSDYFMSKAMLFSFCKRAVINLDSEKSEEIIRWASESKNILTDNESEKKEIYTFSLSDEKATFFASKVEQDESGSNIYITENSLSPFLTRLEPATEQNIPLSITRLKSAAEQNIPTFIAGLKPSAKQTRPPSATKLEQYTKSNCMPTVSNVRSDATLKDRTAKKNRTVRSLYVNTPGAFNVQNALAAFSVCRALGSTNDEIFRGVLLSKTAGRMEIFDTADGKVRIIVDYAHNKMSFEALFETAKRTYNEAPPKITAIFGCSGGKAYNRRYDLPKIALRYSDRIIICEDDSGDEPFESIKSEILANVMKILSNERERYVRNAKISIIKDRKTAIDEAVKSAFENGERRLILFTGRGRESTMLLKSGETPVLSDVSAALNAVKSYNSRLTLDTVFSRLTEKSGKIITVSFENHSDIIETLAASAFWLLRSGITLLAVCSEKSAETLRQQCYKYGTVCCFTNLQNQDKSTSNIRAFAKGSAKRNAITVVSVRQDVKKTAAEISVREKTDTLVYLTRSGGIILNGKPFSSVISEKTAIAISKKFDSRYLNLACTAIRGGVKDVAVIDGRENLSLAFYGTGNGFTGTVIKKA